MLAAVAFAAEPIPCSLDVASEGTDVLLSVPSDGNVDVNLVCSSTETTPGALELALSAFTGDEGSFAVVLLRAQAPAGAKPQQPLKVTVPKTLLVPLRLAAPNLPQSGKYTGRLLILAEGRDPVVRKIVLTREAQRGTLVISPQPVNLTLSRRLLFWRPMKETTFSVALREKTGKVRLEGITARLETVSKAPEGGFTLDRNASFKFNGKDVEHIEETPEARSGGPARDIPAGSQAVVAVTLKNLKAGEYDAVLHFQAANSNDDDAQKLTLTVQTRDCVIWAIGVLVLALVISFYTTKLLVSHRRGASLLMRIREIQPVGIDSEPHSLPVVWVRSVLRQTEELSRRYLLTSPDQIEARITDLERPLELLGRIAGLRKGIAGLGPWIHRRAEVILDHIVSSIGAFKPTDEATAKIKVELDALGLWLEPKKTQDCYWEDLSKSIGSLLGEADLGIVQSAEATLTMHRLFTDLQQAVANPPKDQKGKFEAEKHYAALKILWERRTDPGELAAAIECWNRSADIHSLFTLADDQAWARMEQAIQDKRLWIDMPHTDPASPAEAYELLHVELKTSDPLLEQAFLFQHGLEFHWRFELTYRKWWCRRAKRAFKLVFEPRSAEPRLVEYVPRPGKLTASVRALPAERRHSATGEAAPLYLDLSTDRQSQIRKSSDFAGYKKYHTAEMISWVLASALAVVTGLTTFYFKGSAFGSVQDYLALFAWGTSIDQARNIFQSAQAPSNPSAPASTPAKAS
jgi:hypothetical protein